MGYAKSSLILKSNNTRKNQQRYQIFRSCPVVPFFSKFALPHHFPTRCRIACQFAKIYLLSAAFPVWNQNFKCGFSCLHWL